MIKDVTWNYDAATKDVVFIHIKDEDDVRLVLEVERRRGVKLFRWIIHHPQFIVKVQ